MSNIIQSKNIEPWRMFFFWPPGALLKLVVHFPCPTCRTLISPRCCKASLVWVPPLLFLVSHALDWSSRPQFLIRPFWDLPCLHKAPATWNCPRQLSISRMQISQCFSELLHNQNHQHQPLVCLVLARYLCCRSSCNVNLDCCCSFNLLVDSG